MTESNEMWADANVEEGDRYITAAPCCATCSAITSTVCSSVAKGVPSFLAVAPYSYVFTAPVKGRWLQKSLLPLFVNEFAYIAPPASHGRAGADARQEATELTSLNPCLTVAAYVEELCDGQLWLHGRESECRSAGRLYKNALLSWYDATARGTTGTAQPEEPVHAINGVDAPPLSAWMQVKAWLRAPDGPSPQAVEAWLLETAPPLLILRQKDIVKHRVWRREGRLFADEPVHVIRCDLTRPAASTTSGARLLVVSKPCGLPVHPSGAYRKNSVTSILEDVFGGVDRHRYRAVTSQEEGRPYVSIVHAVRGFELVRLWRSHRNEDGIVSGLSDADVAYLVSLVGPHDSASTTTPARPKAGATHKRSRSPANDEARHPTAPPPRGPLKAFVVHRLDAATSGVLLFGLDSDSARQLATTIANKDEGHITTIPTTPGDCDGQLCSTDHKTIGGIEANPSLSPSAEAALVTEPPTATKAEQSTKTASSAKRYLALVHGRLDVDALANTQYGCENVRLSAEPTSSIDTDHPWLLLRRPIGCLSFHESTYWSPGPQRELQWRAYQARIDVKRQSEEGHSRSNVAHVSCDEHGAAMRDKQKSSKEALMAKHARMRARTHGIRGELSPSSVLPAPGSSEEASTLAAGAERDPAHAFLETLKTATSLVRLVWYDASRNVSLAACQLLSGRTHQLRVHLATLGHPIVGDEKYVALVAALGVCEWQPPHPRQQASSPAPADVRDGQIPEMRMCDGVERFYASHGGTTAETTARGASEAPLDKTLAADSGQPVKSGGADVAAPSATTTSRSCVCPRRIRLHAWRYELQIGAGETDRLTAIAPLPAWASAPCE